MKSRLNWFLTFLFVIIAQIGFAQNKTLTGVVSEDGLPLPGVSVVIQGTQEGTQSDLDGKYSINVKAGDVLVFSFIGMKDVTYKVSNASFYNVMMVDSEETLEEVVVLAYGQTKTKNEITGNVVAVKGDVISNTPVVSVDQALQGRVAGLQISTTSGSPGAMQSVRIRGRNSISGSNEPLYVIDGIPLTSDNISGNSNGTSLSSLSAINSDDIETMTVLKDAAATSAYGARGGNGVILITTKKGKRGAPSYSFRSSIGVQNPARKGPKYLSGEQKKELWLEANYNTFGESEGFSKDQTWDWYVNKYGANNQLVKWVDGGSVDNDWKEAVRVKDAVMSTLSFSVNGGDEKGTYFGSMSHEKYDGTVIGSDFRKVNGTFNFTRNLSDKVEIKVGANVSNIRQNGILEGGAYFSNPNLTAMFMSPWVDVYNPDGSYNINTGGGIPNTLYVIDHNKYQNDITRVISNNSLTYKILDDLRFTSNIGLDYTLANYSTYYNPNYGDGVGTQGLASESDQKMFNYVWQNGLEYKFYLGDSHRFDAKVLMEYQKNKNNYIEASGQVLPPGLTAVGTAAANFGADSNYTDWAQLGFLGMLNYSYDNRYLLDVTFRREGTSRFSEDNKWGNFYAVGGAWNMSSEEFLRDVDGIDLLRLRGSYGQTGNSTFPANRYQQLVAPTSYNNSSGLWASQVGGPLGWEKQAKLDLGIEFGILNNRITGSVAYYQSKSSDLLYEKALSLTTGFERQWINMGDLENKGFEGDINFELIRSADFNWSIGGNITTVRNRITKQPVVDGQAIEEYKGYQAVLEGKPFEAWYLAEYAGVDPQTGNALWYAADGSTTDNFNRAEKRVQNTSALPKITGAVNTHVDFKGFYLDALFTFATGYKIYDGWASYTNAVNSRSLSTYNGSVELLDRWQKPGDITDVPKLTTNGGQTYTSPSTRFLYKGDHIRLRQVTFGYNLNKNAVRALKLDGVNLAVTALNPFTWVRDGRLKADPEVDQTGFIEMATPPIRSVVFSLNVKF